MSVCRFIASDMPLTEFLPPQDYPLEINIDKGTVFDGGADDNYFLTAFANVQEYTEKKYGVCLEWDYTDGRARQILEYIRQTLKNANCVEFWKVWLTDGYEFDDRPFIHRKSVSIEMLTVGHIKEIDEAIIWNKPDALYPKRPSFYCLTITK